VLRVEPHPRSDGVFRLISASSETTSL
jgi:hypothetical protein